MRSRRRFPRKPSRTSPPPSSCGYELLETADCQLTAILINGEQADKLGTSDEAVLLLDKTPFYAESGGQVGDTGVISAGDAEFEVLDTIKIAGVFFGHIGKLKAGSCEPGTASLAAVMATAARRSWCTIQRHI